MTGIRVSSVATRAARSGNLFVASWWATSTGLGSSGAPECLIPLSATSAPSGVCRSHGVVTPARSGFRPWLGSYCLVRVCRCHPPMAVRPTDSLIVCSMWSAVIGWSIVLSSLASVVRTALSSLLWVQCWLISGRSIPAGGASPHAITDLACPQNQLLQFIPLFMYGAWAPCPPDVL